MSNICIKHSGETLPLSQEEFNLILNSIDWAKELDLQNFDYENPQLAELHKRLFHLQYTAFIQRDRKQLEKTEET